MGVFITVTVDDSQLTPAVAQKLVSVCPVDIFGMDNDRISVQTDEEDECTLCELCLHVVPRGVLTIQKNYKDEQLISRGGAS